jgi:dipeptidyl aminopeptidase/acylaminoacyl peptidase
VRAPVLLLHGEFDTVVPKTQSDVMAAALRAAGKKVEYYSLGGEDHWLSSASTRLEVLQRTEKFLAQYLGPASPTAKP